MDPGPTDLGVSVALDAMDLDRDECLDLLATTSLGRVGLSDRALPMIVPVLYRLGPDGIEFDATGRLLPAAAYGGHVVCFEADAADRDTGAGWSVVVVGRLQVVPLPLAAPPRWRGGRGDGIRARLPTALMSGRKLTAV